MSIQVTGNVRGLLFSRNRVVRPRANRVTAEEKLGFNVGYAPLYSYVRNKPLAVTDPLGLGECEETKDYKDLKGCKVESDPYDTCLGYCMCKLHGYPEHELEESAVLMCADQCDKAYKKCCK
jgi:hypothetical protein